MKVAIAVDKAWLIGFLKEGYRSEDSDVWDVLMSMSDHSDVTLIPLNGEGVVLDSAYSFLLKKCGLSKIKISNQNNVINCDIGVTSVYWSRYTEKCKARVSFHFGGTLANVSNSYPLVSWVCLLGEIHRYRYNKRGSLISQGFDKKVHVYR